jgi:hypothetical protein
MLFGGSDGITQEQRYAKQWSFFMPIAFAEMGGKADIETWLVVLDEALNWSVVGVAGLGQTLDLKVRVQRRQG